MGKKKRGDDPSKPVDITSSDPAPNGYSKHRSCWIHVVWSVKASGKKISKKEAQKLRAFKLTAKCFLDDIPCCAPRSKRRRKTKNSISNLKEKKMDDGAFECYVEKLWGTFPEDKQCAFAYLDCIWFKLYRESSLREKVLSWIKKKQIFTKKYVFVPIVCWSHWSLVIFCHFGESLQSKTRTPCILLLDSLQMANPRRLEPDLRKFVYDIYRAEGRPETKKIIDRIPLMVPKVPQQRDDKECGAFVLYYLNLFVEDAPENFTVEGYPYFMKKDWFSAEGVDRFCETLNSFSM